jgi:hypothetical protein
MHHGCPLTQGAFINWWFQEEKMNKRLFVTLLATGGFLLGISVFIGRPGMQAPALAQNHDASDEQITGPYDVVKDWPKPVATLFPEEKGWTWGSTQAIFAQNPNRIFISMRGELPTIKGGDPLNTEVPGIGEDGRGIWLTVPMPGVPNRNASIGPTASPGEPHVKFVAQEGRDYRWQHLVYAVDGEGSLVDGKCAIFIFSNDGKQLLQTIGVPGTCGDDDKHFNRQTDIAWLPDGTFFVSDGYENTRVVKFDKTGKYLTSWGKPSWDWKTRKDVPGVPNPPPPNYFHTVHGIQVDPVTRRVFVSDRENHRIQVFDENGKFLDVWPLGPYAAIYHLLLTEDKSLWMSDGHGTFKILKYDLDGKMLYQWGTFGPLPGEMWGVHEFTTDQQGNLYTAEVFNGRPQKFRPKAGADPSHLVGKQMRVAWKD